MKSKGILFAGLPQTGKTTFMAALWYYIFNSYANEEYVVTTAADEEKEYLNQRSIEWASFTPVFRTSQSIIERVVISMRRTSTGEVFTLDIPDVSGEAFRRQFQSRDWDTDFKSVIDDTEGILLFIDPMDAKNSPTLLYHEHEHYRFFGDVPPAKGQKGIWSHEHVPNQVKLVDFLQMVNYHKPRTISSISIIVSCWDLVEKTADPQTPLEWCKIKMPLLYQFLTANEDTFKTKYFGVSAQGGNYDDAETLKTMQEKPPMERIMIVDGHEKTNKILSPILWIIDEN